MKINDMNIEKVDPEYLDKKIEQKVSFYRFDQRGKRLYLVIDGNKHYIVPSVTTIIDEFHNPKYLSIWRGDIGNEKANWILRQSANYGTYLHVVFGKLMRGQSVILQDEIIFTDMEIELSKGKDDFDIKEIKKWLKEKKRGPKKDIWGFVKFLYDIKPEILGIEVMVYSKTYAGCVDIICKINDKICLIDIKTGNESDHHVYQLYALAEAWNLNYPEHKIDRILNYYCKDYKLPLKKKIKPYKLKERYLLDGFSFTYDLIKYHKKYGKPKIKPEYTFSTKQINIETNPDEFIEKIDLVKDILEQKEEF